MRFRQARLSECKQELQSLVNDHWVEINEFGSTESKVNWDLYDGLDASGMLVLFLAEDDDGICGYDCYIILPCPQNTDILQANTNGIFLRKDKRGGKNAMNLLKFSEQQLKNMGVKSITAGVLPSKDYSPLLLRLGYHVVETMYAKVVN